MFDEKRDLVFAAAAFFVEVVLQFPHGGVVIAATPQVGEVATDNRDELPVVLFLFFILFLPTKNGAADGSTTPFCMVVLVGEGWPAERSWSRPVEDRFKLTSPGRHLLVTGWSVVFMCSTWLAKRIVGTRRLVKAAVGGRDAVIRAQSTLVRARRVKVSMDMTDATDTADLNVFVPIQTWYEYVPVSNTYLYQVSIWRGLLKNVYISVY